MPIYKSLNERMMEEIHAAEDFEFAKAVNEQIAAAEKALSVPHELLSAPAPIPGIGIAVINMNGVKKLELYSEPTCNCGEDESKAKGEKNEQEKG